jgi:hypothetical protein
MDITAAEEQHFITYSVRKYRGQNMSEDSEWETPREHSTLKNANTNVNY